MTNRELTLDKNLTFRQAYYHMLNGEKVKRPNWKGYWEIGRSNYDHKITINMMCYDEDSNYQPEKIDIRLTQNVLYTFENIVATDWEVVKESEEQK